MRNALLILLLTLGMAATAQDRLEPVRKLTKEDGLCRTFYEQEQEIDELIVLFSE